MPTCLRVRPPRRRRSAAWTGAWIAALLLAGAAPRAAHAADAQRVSAGGDFTCALADAGAVLCWGDNQLGQLGNGTGMDGAVPAPVSGFAGGATGLDAGEVHACAVDGAGDAWCWGSNGAGQLGDGTQSDSDVPVAVSGLASPLASVAAGVDHTCALTAGGAVLCWGANADGQLGDGSNTQSLVPVPVIGLASGATGVSLGTGFGCALTEGGGVVCWGRNGSGQLGNGGGGDSNVPVPVSGLSSGVAAVSAGAHFACALLETGEVRCWGNNAYGQLGQPPGPNSDVPVTVGGLPPDVAVLSAGYGHACAAADSGGAWCWGYNGSGQLGDGTTVDGHVPVAVDGLPMRIDVLSGGVSHSCAVTHSGSLLCWGLNADGQIGQGTASRHLLPTQVVGAEGGVASAAAGETHTCAVQDGGALCWGDNQFGQLGTGSSDPTPSGVPLPVSGLGSGVASVTAGESHGCALTDAGGVLCWGRNDFGQVGSSSAPPFSVTTPLAVDGLSSGVVDVAAGQFHTCAALGNGEARCWGDNGGAQLGDGTTTGSNVPVVVSGLSDDVGAVATGSNHSCALTVGGTVECWGTGWLGNGSVSLESPPVPVTGLSNVQAVAAGPNHACALSLGDVFCWGENGSGQLGDGTTTDRGTPVAVSGLPADVAALATGRNHTCAVTTAGDALCWGDNFWGQLGDGTRMDRLLPVAVGALPDPMQGVTAGSFHSCAFGTSGGLRCWGDNGWLQIGNDFQLHHTSPVAVVGFEEVPAVPALGAWAAALLSALLAGAARRGLR